jgi:hypothetical protein
VDAYYEFSHLMTAVVQTLGEGYALHKQDVFSKRTFHEADAERAEFLSRSYFRYFEGRRFIDCKTYLVITQEVIAREGKQLVYIHYNLIVCCDRQVDMQKPTNHLENLFGRLGMHLSKRAYNQLELFVNSFPGNCYGMSADYDRFLTLSDAATCFMYKEHLTQSEDTPRRIHYTDRQGVPVAIDITGKEGAIKLTDNSNSYEGLCEYLGDKYISYTEERPITMNPFHITREELNIEKVNFLKNLILQIWKGSNGVVSKTEDRLIGQTIDEYYKAYFAGDIQVTLSFNSFFEYATVRVTQIIEENELKGIDVVDLNYQLRDFYRGGSHETTLNENMDSSLFDETFIVFEIDAIKDDPTLFPIVTLIIMDVFLQKMRLKKNRKVLVIEEAWKAIATPPHGGVHQVPVSNSSGIDNVTGEALTSISAKCGVVYVSGKEPNDEVSVYTMTGTLLTKTKDNRIPLSQSGAFLILVKQKAQKMVLKMENAR